MTDFPPLAELAAEEAELQLTRFTNDDAWALGSALVARAQREQLPVAIEVSRHSHQLFHAALAGALPDPHDRALLVWTADRDVVERFAASDPYVVHGLVTAWSVRRWDVVVGGQA